MDVTIRQLRVFQKIAICRNFRIASEQLSISQPALSIAIKRFEDGLGATLLDRTTRRVSLTKEGEWVAAIADRVLSDFDRTIGELRRGLKDRGRQVTIAVSVTSIIPVFFPSLLKEVSRTRPDLKVRVLSGLSSEVRKRVEIGEADLGIVSTCEQEGIFTHQELMHDPLVMIGRNDMAIMAERGPVSPSQVRGQSIIAWAEGGGMRQIIDRDPELKGAMQQASYELSDWQAIEGMICEGMGISIVPRLVAELVRKDSIGFREIEGHRIGRDVFLISKRDTALPAAAITLKALLEKYVSETNLR